MIPRWKNVPFRFGPARPVAVAAILCALSLPTAFAAEVSLVEPTPEAAVAVVAKRPEPPSVAADWRPKLAPGSTAVPASDTRREWAVLRGWQKIVVSEKGAAGPAREQELPDIWARNRDEERAWYVLRADLGPRLPPSLWMRFDAVAYRCEVFVNGRHVGGHVGGFTPFELEITAAARPGANTVALFVRDEHAVHLPEKQAVVSQLGVTHPGAFTSVAGIRGGVFFEARAPVHVDHVLVHTSTRTGEIQVRTTLRAPAATEATVTHAVYPWPNGGTPALEFPAIHTRTDATAAVAVQWPNALRWSPEHPNLYVLRTTVTAAGQSETTETRFGFREFWAEGKNFMLNGTPIRLLGTSVARDLTGSETPEVGRRYSRAALEYLKREFNYRAMRLHASIFPPGAADAADEVGVLLINQSAIWSAMGGHYQRGGAEFLANMEREFAEWFWRDANKPSVAIWDVENEMIRDVRTPDRERWVLALDRFIKQLDPTRIVEHSGAAWYSPAQETIHIHMQEQYAEPLRAWERDGKVPLVLGEFWVGGRGGETRLANAHEFAGRLDWLQEEARQYREKIFEMRYHGASGVLPFWLDRSALGRTTNGTRKTFEPEQDKLFFWPYPEFRNVGAEALAPVIGFAWPRASSVAAGAPLDKEIVVCNDRETSATLGVTCELAGQRREWQVTLAPAAQDRRKVTFPKAADGELLVSVTDSVHATGFRDALAVHVIPAAQTAPPVLQRQLVVVPAPDAATAAALRSLGLTFEAAATLPADAAHTLVIVPPSAPRDALGRNHKAIRQYLNAGGRLLALHQATEPNWLPLSLPFWSAMKKSEPEFTLLGWPTATRHLLFSREVVTYAANHPAFAGLNAADFKEWSPLDGRVADDAFVRPSALERRAGGPYRVLAGGTRRENATLVESVCGDGTALFCQLHVLELPHPAARGLLFNLLRYLDRDGWTARERQIGLMGDLTAARLARLIGVAPNAIVAAAKSTTAPRVIVATDGSEPSIINELVRGGHTVLVLSQQTANRLPGYAAPKSDRVIAATRAGVADEPLFWGIASGSFTPVEQSPVTGVLSKFPAAARVALNGISAPAAARARRAARPGSSVDVLDTMDADKPIAVVETVGAGKLVVSTIEPWNDAKETHRQLLTTLLANAGVALPMQDEMPDVISVKTTVPLQLDGRLDDWTNDMEDRNVSLFQHAVPIVLSSRDASGPQPGRDNDLSAIVYLLHDATKLYVGGVVFSKEAARLQLRLGTQTLDYDLGRGALTVGSKPVAEAKLVMGRQPAREVADTRLLTLATLNAQIGSLSAAADLAGRTFESSIPWAALGLAREPEIGARLRLSTASGATIEVPVASDPTAAALTLRFDWR